MATCPLLRAVERLRQSALACVGDGPSDGELLTDFISRRDESAFAALVRRHGPMVLGVCRRVVGNIHDAEDAFQATFLVLVRRAESVVPREAVGNFLHGVAYRTALEARRLLLRRLARERREEGTPEPTFSAEESMADLRLLLDQELSRLPDPVRLPVILCDLEGRTRRDVARQLNLPTGTLNNRLAAGRKLLARRLRGRGVTLSAALATVPTALLTSTIKAATHVAAGGAAAQVVSARAAALTDRVMRSTMTKTFTAMVSAVLMAGLLAGVGALAPAESPRPARDDKPPTEKPKDAPVWKTTATLTGHKDRVDAVAFSPDGKTLATGSADGTIILWDVATGKQSHTLEGHGEWVHQVAFSPDGKTLATAGDDKTARLWEVATGKQIQSFGGLTYEVHSVAFSPDGKTLATGGGFNPRQDEKGASEVALWDPATGKELGTRLEEHTNRVAYLAFSPDGKTLITGGHDNCFKLWDYDGKGGLKLRETVEAGGTQGLYGMALSPDGKTLAFVSNGGIKLYDLTAGKVRDELEGFDTGWHDFVAFSPDGKTVAMNSIIQKSDGKTVEQASSVIRMWEVATGKLKEKVEVDEPSESLAFGPDGKTLAVGCRGRIKFPAGETLKPEDVEQAKDGPVKLLRLGM